MMWIWLLILIVAVSILAYAWFNDIEHGPPPEVGFVSLDGIDFWEDDI